MQTKIQFEDIKYLSVELPEDIQKRKWAGDFAGADSLIQERLQRELPVALRKKLLLEREILKQLPSAYPYSVEEALQEMQKQIPDFTLEELRTLQEQGRIDWIYVNGQGRIFQRFIETLLKVNPQIKNRAAAWRQESGRKEERETADISETKIKEQLLLNKKRTDTEEKWRSQVDRKEKREDTAAEEIKEQLLLNRQRKDTEEDAIEQKEKQALYNVIQTIQTQGTAAVRFHIRASLQVKEQAFQKGAITVHLPVPAESLQQQEIQIQALTDAPYQLASAKSGQRTICFQEEMQRNHPFMVEYTYTNRVDYVNLYTEEAEKLAELTETDKKMQDFFQTEDLEEQLPHIRFTPFMAALAEEIIGKETNPLRKARKIYDYITTAIEYSFVRDYFTIENLSEYAAIGGKGDCGIQSLVFITLCRIAGIPARWQSGLYTTPYTAGCHDWAQVYLAPYGWRYVDCSFGGSAHRDNAEERRQFYFGNLDPFRMVANGKFQQEFDVPKQFLRADPYDNQRGEAEYEDRGLTFREMTWKAEVLETEMF